MKQNSYDTQCHAKLVFMTKNVKNGMLLQLFQLPRWIVSKSMHMINVKPEAFAIDEDTLIQEALILL